MQGQLASALFMHIREAIDVVYLNRVAKPPEIKGKLQWGVAQKTSQRYTNL
jgi:hypothetical protein